MTPDGVQQPKDFWTRVASLADSSRGGADSAARPREGEKSTVDYWSRVQQLADSVLDRPATTITDRSGSAVARARTSDRVDHARLVAIARRHMPESEDHVIEDVVSKAFARWLRAKPDLRTTATLVQLVRSEAYSFLRREHRARQRAIDRQAASGSLDDLQASALRDELVELAREANVRITTRDMKVLELALAGFTFPEISRRTGLNRHVLRRSWQVWRDLLLKHPGQSRSER